MNLRVLVYFLSLIILPCCVEKAEQSQLTPIFEKLSSQNKISRYKLEIITSEYKWLQSENPLIASSYVGMLETLANLNKDSVSIDLARERFISENIIDVNKIAGRLKKAVILYLGKPDKVETVSPSKTPCPCEKIIYRNPEIEIVFIKGMADWITLVPNTKKIIKIPKPNTYQSVSKGDFIYIKVNTP